MFLILTCTPIGEGHGGSSNHERGFATLLFSAEKLLTPSPPPTLRLWYAHGFSRNIREPGRLTPGTAREISPRFVRPPVLPDRPRSYRARIPATAPDWPCNRVNYYVRNVSSVVTYKSARDTSRTSTICNWNNTAATRRSGGIRRRVDSTST